MRFATVLTLSLLSGVAYAQPAGPADIMNGANRGRERAEVARAVNAAETALAPDGGVAATTDVKDAERQTAVTPPAPTRDPHQVLAEPQMAVAEAKASLPVGSIEVEVVDPLGRSVANAEIVLGVMAGLGGRTEQRARSDAQGRHTFTKLATGTQQAYRVNVLADGAKFSTMPFRLPDESGYYARVPLRTTTFEQKMLFQVIGQTVVELRDDRLHFTQQAKLANAGERVIVFPKDGLEVPLPKGFTAFNWQDVMTDQKGEELHDKGFRIRGSLPPGSVTLAWTFDLPRSGDSAKIAISQPWRTYQYRVISEAPPGLKLRVSEFPEPEQIKDKDRDLLFTQIQRSPSDAQLAAFTIKLEGIPAPGPGRWIALVLAVLAIGVGLSKAFSLVDDRADRKLEIDARKKHLLALARQTEAELERGEIGPQYRAEKLDEIVTELALLLRDEEALGKITGKTAAKTSAKPA